jgi:lysophospholipase L1-like esterase
MKELRRALWTLGAALLVSGVALNAAADTKDPTQWAPAMRAFEIADSARPPPLNEVVFVGSSSVAFWRTLQEDIAPLKVINRGFGGSTMEDVIYWLDAVVLKYKPRAVVVYEGDNDIALGKTPEDVLTGFERLVSLIHAADPQVRVYFLAIKPTVRRWGIWPEMDRANLLVNAFCEHRKLARFIDVASPMLDRQGKPRVDIFESDGLHMNATGYALWTSKIRPVLLEFEASP